MLKNNSCLIEPGHCYGVLGLTEVNYKGNMARYILLKNPNGGSEAENGRPMPQDLKIMLEKKSTVYNDVSNEVGLFWLSLGDLKKNFDSFTNCKLKENYCSSAYEIKNKDPNNTTFLLKASGVKGTHAYISLFRMNIRFFADKNSHEDFGTIKYGVSRIVIFQKNKVTGNLEILGYGFHSKQTAFSEITIDNEEFFVYVECDYFLKKQLDLTVSCYTSKPVMLDYMETETNEMRQDNGKELLKALIASFALKNCKIDNPLELKEFKANNGAICKRYYGEMLGYIAFVYFNEGATEVLEEEYIVKE